MNESLTFAQALSEFHFIRPLWLLALVPAFFFFRRLWILDARGSAWQKVVDPNLLPFLLSKTKAAEYPAGPESLQMNRRGLAASQDPA